MRDLDALFAALGESRFRRRFGLGEKEQAYLARKSLPVILQHGRELLTQRLAAAVIPNDGRQTPLRGHPVFVAQHATGTCCRKCLAKWHRIDQDRQLTNEELSYLVEVIARWLRQQMLAQPPDDGQPKLFE